MTTTKGRQTAATSEGPHGSARSARAKAEVAARSGNGRAEQVPETAQKATCSSATAPFAGLAEAAARWLPERVAEAWTESLSEASKGQWPASGATNEAWDYWVDSWQRSILFWDVLRKRGNQAIEHYRAGKPPVLVFDYEMVVDGRQLERSAACSCCARSSPQSALR
jgi:hypothetical protein